MIRGHSLAVMCVLVLSLGCTETRSAPATSSAEPAQGVATAVASPPSERSTARPEVPGNAVPATRDEAVTMLGAHATAAEPLLFPASIPAQWTIHVLIDEHGAAPDEYSLWFGDRDSGKVVQLSVRGSNSLLPTPHTEDTDPYFRNDPKSYYRVADARDPRSDRKLVWFERGVSQSPGGSGTGYSLTTAGITDEEFWRIANSLEPIAR